MGTIDILYSTRGKISKTFCFEVKEVCDEQLFYVISYFYNCLFIYKITVNNSLMEWNFIILDRQTPGEND